jgi:hypothetical protein
MGPQPRRRLGASVLAAVRAIAGPTLPLPPSRAVRCCPGCGRDRLTVTDRSRQDDGLELLSLRCGECGVARTMAATRSQSAALLAYHETQRRLMMDPGATLDEELASILPPGDEVT